MRNLFFIFLLIFINIYGETNQYLIGTQIEIQSEKKSIFKLIKFPMYSELSFEEDKGKEFIFIPDAVGSYTLSIDDGKEKTFREFNIFNKEEYKDNKIYDIMDKCVEKEDGVCLKESIKDIFRNNMQKENTKNYIVKYIDYLLEKDNSYMAYEVYNSLDSLYKLSIKESTELLIKIYNNLKETSKLNIILLEKLCRYDEKYKIVLAEKRLELGENIEESLKLLVEEYKKSPNSKLAEFLANYYLSIGDIVKSEGYLRNSDMKKVALSFYKRELDEVGDFIYQNFLDDSEKAYINRNKALLRELNSMESYYQSAINNLKKERYQLAEMYFKKIIGNGMDEKLVKESTYNLAKLYLYDKKFEESLKFFSKYLEDYGDIRSAEALYSIAIIYYNLKNYEKSDKILNRIIETYPLTVWSTKASIYKLQIENKGEKNES
jgi:tetratricopeptide (TPR) repeat protein